jgi:acyl-CoA synthetase (AMP-forming)/AMP-acid ligase II
MHVQFIDRLGDTFRWKGHNVSTTEVEQVLNLFDQVSLSSVYGVKIVNTDGRAGMAAIVSDPKIKGFNFKKLANLFEEHLAPYAIPVFLRLKSNLSTTHSFKFKKVNLKKEGFDPEVIEDPLYRSLELYL